MSVKSKELVSQMTLEEKASLCSGRDFWNLKGIPRLGLEPVMVTDGPHGLRKQAESADHLGINQSVPAVCFPTAAATACSFDKDLLEEMGKALGEECQAEKVAVILGPGANIKRSPLCGRNFEYFSEDPLLGGDLAAALIQGIESRGVGTSLKHYAVNNQERRRMTINAVVDERALREIYLAGFERAVKKGKPSTVMCSYNRINGIYASENKKILTDILRDEWGFGGLVVTDWGATNDRVEGIRAGLDLEMPSSGGRNDAKIVEAVKNGSLDEALLDITAERVTDLILKAQSAGWGGTYDKAAHQAVARKAARESAVLLKNDDALPVKAASTKAAVIGAFAKQPRYQGAGSSRINPTQLDNAYDALKEQGLVFDYADGYSLKPGSGPDQALIDEACAAARGKDIAFVFAGLPDEYESEGFDRENLSLPESHNRLIEAVAKVNPRTVVILLCGAPALLPWAAEVKAILLAYLGGQAGGGAIADLLLGKFSPCGKLAETWPKALEDNSSFAYFPGTIKTVEYRESIFAGYRYYDTANISPAWPFGFGLSYTTFSYGNLQVLREQNSSPAEVSVEVKNSGDVPGAEIVQLYIGLPASKIFRARRELKGFEKVFLQPGETKKVTFKLDDRSFAYYNVPAKDWAVETGSYLIEVGASSRDIRLSADISVKGDGKEALLADLQNKAAAYYNLVSGGVKTGPWKVPDADFSALLGTPLPAAARSPGEPYTMNSTVAEVYEHPAGKAFLEALRAGMAQFIGSVDETMARMFEAMIMDMPLRGVLMLGQGQITEEQLTGLLTALNG
ncbi:glycosyl hydrolase [Spirochaetia bacterium]|nr:glycosyl hydrolase [Spirochaetia bacterium]